MQKVLRGGAYGPGGPDDYVPAGEPPKKSWPTWFIADLEAHGHLVDAPATSRTSGEKVELTASSSRGRKNR